MADNKRAESAAKCDDFPAARDNQIISAEPAQSTTQQENSPSSDDFSGINSAAPNFQLTSRSIFSICRWGTVVMTAAGCESCRFRKQGTTKTINKSSQRRSRRLFTIQVRNEIRVRANRAPRTSLRKCDKSVAYPLLVFTVGSGGGR